MLPFLSFDLLQTRPWLSTAIIPETSVEASLNIFQPEILRTRTNRKLTSNVQCNLSLQCLRGRLPKSSFNFCFVFFLFFFFILERKKCVLRLFLHCNPSNYFFVTIANLLPLSRTYRIILLFPVVSSPTAHFISLSHYCFF